MTELLNSLKKDFNKIFKTEEDKIKSDLTKLPQLIEAEEKRIKKELDSYYNSLKD